MSIDHKDGGRAFPCDQIIERDANGHLHGKEVASGGMALRDYFAANALTALLVRVDTISGDWVSNAAPIQAAESAYEYADAMLKARKS